MSDSTVFCRKVRVKLRSRIQDRQQVGRALIYEYFRLIRLVFRTHSTQIGFDEALMSEIFFSRKSCFYPILWTKCTKSNTNSRILRFGRVIFRNHIKLRFIMNSDTLICIWILVFLIGLFEVSTQRKLSFCLYSSSIHDYWPPNTRNSLVHNSWSVMERCKYVQFSSSKYEKRTSDET